MPAPVPITFWHWAGFILIILVFLALDLGVFHRSSRVIKSKEALLWSAVWFSLAILFARGLDVWRGLDESLEFVTGYFVEFSLSMDNVVAIALIFTCFGVAARHQHRVLFWGILGALVMRGVFIVTGVGLISRFSWITYAFGALLVYSGFKLLRQGETEIHPEKNAALRLFRRAFPVTKDYVGGQFFTRRFFGQKSGLYATPLLVALLVVETSDILFAVDSIPAVLAITLNAFIVYTSNVFAILGLRSMYFALAGMMDKLLYLHYGLSVVLILIGLKMLGSHYVYIPTGWALAIVLFVLGASILASLVNKQEKLAE